MRDMTFSDVSILLHIHIYAWSRRNYLSSWVMSFCTWLPINICAAIQVCESHHYDWVLVCLLHPTTFWLVFMYFLFIYCLYFVFFQSEQLQRLFSSVSLYNKTITSQQMLSQGTLQDKPIEFMCRNQSNHWFKFNHIHSSLTRKTMHWNSFYCTDWYKVSTVLHEVIDFAATTALGQACVVNLAAIRTCRWWQ